MRHWLLAGFLLLLSSPLLAQKEDWLPITPEELQMKEVPGDPGAPAVLLYYANYVDDQTELEFFYLRIKVLTEKGKEYANLQIELGPGFSLENLKARTIHPDGSITDFSGKPLDQVLIKGRGIKVLAKSLVLPDVQVGSIIEYRYRLLTGGFRTSDHWVLQHELYTVKERFAFRPSPGGALDFLTATRVAWVALHLPRTETPVLKDKIFQLERQNVPAFQAEPLMPPQAAYRPSVSFFYISSATKNIDQFWEELGKWMAPIVEKSIAGNDQIKQAALQAIGNETDPEKKLRKLYERAQQIRNLSFERKMSAEEQKKEKIKDINSVADILKFGYGYHLQINRLFAALARAAGFNASVLRVSDRGHRFFTKDVLSSRQLDAEIILVALDGKELYFDPGTKFCPFGLVPWMFTSTAALKLNKTGGTFVTTPAASEDNAVIRRRADVTLRENGLLQGEITIEFNGDEALERRVAATRTDQAGRSKQLQDELQDSLPASAIVKLLDVQGWEAQAGPLVARFSIQIPAYASVSGKRLLTPAYLFQENFYGAFNSQERKYPVYFPYPFKEIDTISINLPPGYSIESVPGPRNFKLASAWYENSKTLQGPQLITSRQLVVSDTLFSPGQYAELKQFFNQVRDSDEQQAVLRAGN